MISSASLSICFLPHSTWVIIGNQVIRVTKTNDQGWIYLCDALMLNLFFFLGESSVIDGAFYVWYFPLSKKLNLKKKKKKRRRRRLRQVIGDNERRIQSNGTILSLSHWQDAMWSDEKLVINRTNKLQNPILYICFCFSIGLCFLALMFYPFPILNFYVGTINHVHDIGNWRFKAKKTEILKKGGIQRHSCYTCASLDNPNGYGVTSHESNSQPSSTWIGYHILSYLFFIW